MNPDDSKGDSARVHQLAPDEVQAAHMMDILRAIHDSFDSKHGVKLTGFMAMAGQQWSGDLMVVGRAVNGWSNGWCAKDADTAANRSAIVKEIQQSVTSTDKCPMKWVSEQWGSRSKYNTNRSAFWRVIRRLVGDMAIADINHDSWPSHLVWTNLCKVSPYSGGNPASWLFRVQLDGCLKLLHAEMKQYAPRRILFLTGLHWSRRFLDGLGADWSETGEALVPATGVYRNPLISWEIPIVVAVHPQGKREIELAADIRAHFMLVASRIN